MPHTYTGSETMLGAKKAKRAYGLDWDDLRSVRPCAVAWHGEMYAIGDLERARGRKQARVDREESERAAAKERAAEAEHGWREGLAKWRRAEQHAKEGAELAVRREREARTRAAMAKMLAVRGELAESPSTTWENAISRARENLMPADADLAMDKTDAKEIFLLKDADIKALPTVQRPIGKGGRMKAALLASDVCKSARAKHGGAAASLCAARMWPTPEGAWLHPLRALEAAYPRQAQEARREAAKLFGVDSVAAAAVPAL